MKIIIHDYFGYTIPMNERYRLIHEAGFDGVMLDWNGFPNNPHETKHLNPDFAAKNGLCIENLHTPYLGCNNIWLDGIDGDEYLNTQLSCVDDCVEHNIPTMVVHVSSGKTSPAFGTIGLERLKKLVCKAESNNINIAFENLRLPAYIRYVFDNIQSERIKFCFDIGHWNCHTPNEDILGEFGGRLIALHLHDNDGTGDQHLLPFDGKVDWNTMSRIKAIGYCGSVCLEVGNGGHETMLPTDFLQLAYSRAVKLRHIIQGKSVITSDFRIIYAEDKDIPAWLELVNIVAYDFPGLDTESYTETLKKNIARKTALCVKEDGNIVGMLLFSPHHHSISFIAVHPEYRQNGIASALIAEMLHHMPDGDINVTTFREDDPKGISPRALYQKFGFVPEELITEFDYPLQRFLLYRCNKNK